VNSVFLLWHSYDRDGHDEDKLLGVFSSRGRAEAAIAGYSQQPGFAEHPDGFMVSENVVDRTEWTKGFITVES
jgi:hypothetical protein